MSTPLCQFRDRPSVRSSPLRRWRVIPTHAVASLTHELTDYAVSHAANELVPWGLGNIAELDARLSGVVEELIVAHPEGSVPSFVVGESVHELVGLN